MHALVAPPHVDHLHPDAVIALATAADGRELTRRCFGDEVVWVVAPARLPARPRHAAAPGRPSRGDRLRARRPRHHRWGDTSEECEAQLDVISRTAEAFIAEHGTPGAVRCRGARLRAPAAAGAAASAPPRWPRILRGIASHRRADGRPLQRRAMSCSTSSRGPRRRASPRSARRAPTTSCARRSRRWSLDLPADAAVTDVVARLRELHAAYREEYRAYYERHAEPDSPADARRRPRDRARARRRHVLFGADKQTARVAGEFYVNAINVMRGAESLSTTAPIAEREKFRIEYWALEEAKLQRLPKPKPLADADRPRHRRRLRHRPGDRAAARGRGRLRRRRRPRRRQRGRRRRRDRRTRRAPSRCRSTSPTPTQCRGRVRRGGAGVRRRRPRRQQRRPVDLEAAARDRREPTGTCSTT